MPADLLQSFEIRQRKWQGEVFGHSQIDTCIFTSYLALILVEKRYPIDILFTANNIYGNDTMPLSRRSYFNWKMALVMVFMIAFSSITILIPDSMNMFH